MFSCDVDVLMHMHKSRRTLHPRDKKELPPAYKIIFINIYHNLPVL